MLKELTPEQIHQNWNNLMRMIEIHFSDDRLEKLLKMYNYFEERMCVAPASGKEHFHNAHAGGYVEHVIHVTTSALKIKPIWEQSGASIGFTDEELVFAAMHHDLGKVGDLAEDYYTPNDSEWHRKNQGLVYKHNPRLEYMTVTDRALFLLQHFGIEMTTNEYIGLRLTDGLYEDANKTYYMNWSKDNALRTNIAHILHQADMMASRIEYDMWKRGDYTPKPNKEKAEQSKKANQAFKELFGD
tara:strand:+ start:598 stop:1326 length:729 start_codon:yes stop_codon:yes gene_type:complete